MHSLATDLLATVPAGLARLSPRGVVRHANDELACLLGTSPDALVGLPLAALLHPDDGAALAHGLAALAAGRHHRLVLRARLAGRDGPVAAELRVAAERDAAGAHAGMVALVLGADVSANAVEPCPDEAALLTRMERLLGRARVRPGAAFALLWVELAAVLPPESLPDPGAAARLCLRITTQMREALRPVDMVARVEAGRFAVLLHGVHDEVDAFHVARRLHQVVAAALRNAGWRMPPRPGMGIAFCDADAGPAQMLADARDAATAALAQDVPVAAADARRHDRAVQHLRVQDDLPGALAGGELRLHFQPIVAVASGEVEGVEALVRWAHPRDGLLMPDRFVPAAERTGLVGRLDEWVLEAACAQLSEWLARGVLAAGAVVSVNLSAWGLARPDLAACVAATLARTGLPPRSLQLEVTETALLASPELAARSLDELRATGVRVAVDDFGAGYSSLGYLHRIPVDVLKLDRSLLHARRPGPGGAPLLEAVVALAHHLDLPVTVEGVEEEAEVARLRALGCAQAQGYAFSPPLPPAELETILRGEVLPGA